MPDVLVIAPRSNVERVKQIADARMEGCHHWQRLACRVTMTAHPALSMPVGFPQRSFQRACNLSGGIGTSWRCCVSRQRMTTQRD